MQLSGLLAVGACLLLIEFCEANNRLQQSADTLGLVRRNKGRVVKKVDPATGQLVSVINHNYVNPSEVITFNDDPEKDDELSNANKKGVSKSNKKSSSKKTKLSKDQKLAARKAAKESRAQKLALRKSSKPTASEGGSKAAAPKPAKSGKKPKAKKGGRSKSKAARVTNVAREDAKARRSQLRAEKKAKRDQLKRERKARKESKQKIKPGQV